MKKTRLVLAFCFATSILLRSLAAGQSQKTDSPAPAAQKTEAKTATVSGTLVYKPPFRGAPVGRVGGGTRSDVPDRTVVLSVLTPDHTGLTTHEQPSLFWFVSQPTKNPVELTMLEDKSKKTILEKQLAAPIGPGVQRVRLADYGTRLAPGVEYRWFVAIVADPTKRSSDSIAGGFIQRVEPSASLLERLKQGSPRDVPSVYAEEGIWYDALSSLSDQIDAAPNNTDLRAQRAALLDQVRLREVAEFERR